MPISAIVRRSAGVDLHYDPATLLSFQELRPNRSLGPCPGGNHEDDLEQVGTAFAVPPIPPGHSKRQAQALRMLMSHCAFCSCALNERIEVGMWMTARDVPTASGMPDILGHACSWNSS